MRVSNEDALGRVRELLKKCCGGSYGCGPGSLHECDRPGAIHFEPVEDPGALPPEGPLTGSTQAPLTRITGELPTRGNRVRLLEDGVQSYGAMLELIETAEREIRFENFILLADEVGLAFADALRARASQGVEVRILLDALGSLIRRRAPLGLIRDPAPAALRIFNPPRPTLAFLRAGRDHRKLLVQDGRRAVVGGLCLADAWLGNCVRRCTWRDSAVLVEGAAAARLELEFDRLWGHPATRGALKGSGHGDSGRRPAGRDRAASAFHGAVPVRVIRDGPQERRLERVLVQVAAAARREIVITNPYFIPTRPLARALTAAAGRGVDVQLVIPRFNDHAVVGLTSEHRLGPLLKAGVRAWRWQGPMIHAKTVVVDRCWSLIGSSNLDPLSLRRNLELNLEIHGSTIGEQMAEVFARDRAGSEPYSYEDWRGRPLFRRAAGALSALASDWQ